jgi:serine/threonine protein kinase
MLNAADQAIQAVAAIHKAGILHRDIKPSTPGRSRRRRLSDFGLARLTDQSDWPPPATSSARWAT